MEPTSEQELKKLLDEDRITHEEYEQLLDAMKVNHSTNPKMSRKKMQRLGIILAIIFFAFAMVGMKPLLHSNSLILQVIYMIGIVLTASSSAYYSLSAAFYK
jgi:hypothetical protein